MLNGIDGMSDNKRIAKNTMFLYLRMLLVMGVSLYTSRVVLKTLGFEDYGLYNVVGGIVTMFTFLNGALGSATSRYITFELGRKDFLRLNKVFNIALIIHLLLSAIIILLAETVGLWFFYEKMTIPPDRLHASFWVYQISIITCAFSLTQVPYNAMIIAYENMKIYAYVGIAEVLLKLGIVYLIQISPIDKLIFYALLLCLLQIGIMMFYRYFCNKHFEACKLHIYKDKALFKEIFSFAGSDLIGNISVLAQGQGLNILLNMFFGPAVNAARGIAYQVQGAITQFGNNFMTAVKPQIVKLYAEGKIEEMMKLVKQSSCFSFYLMWLISLPICLEAHYILSLWLGDYPDHTVNFLILIIILCLIQTIKTPRVTVFHATGHIQLTNIVVGSILCAAFPIAYVLLKIGGTPESVFWAANLTMVISEIASVLILKKYINFSIPFYFVEVHGRCILVALISFIVPYWIYDQWMDESFLRLVLTCITTSISVGITSLYVGMNKHTRDSLFRMLKFKILHK